MTTLSAAADAHVDASPEVVLAILRDLDGHHRRILPPAFSDFEVLHGGDGDGTLSRFKFRLGGRTTEVRTLTTETNPGVIREQVLGRDMVTEFHVVSEDEARASRSPPSGPRSAGSVACSSACSPRRCCARFTSKNWRSSPAMRLRSRAARRCPGRCRRPPAGSTAPRPGGGRGTASTGRAPGTGAGGRSAGSPPRVRPPIAAERPGTIAGGRRGTRSRRCPPHRGFGSTRSRHRDGRIAVARPARVLHALVVGSSSARRCHLRRRPRSWPRH